MPIFKEVSSLDPIEEGLRILIQGPVSSGKSFLAASIGEPNKKAYIFDFDGKLSALARHPNAANIVGKSYLDPSGQQGAVEKPTAFEQLLLDIGELEYQKKIGKLQPAYYIFDTLTFLEASALRLEMYKNPSARNSITIGGSSIHVPSGYDVYKAVKIEMEYLIFRLFALGDTIVNAHERPEIDRTVSSKAKEDERITGLYSLEPPRLNVLKSLFKDKYRVSRIGGQHIVSLQSNDDFLGACTFNGVKDHEEADLAKIIAKHREFMAKKKVPTLALPEGKVS